MAALHLTLLLVAVIIAMLAGLLLGASSLVKQWRKKGGDKPFVRMTIELGSPTPPAISPPPAKQKSLKPRQAAEKGS